MAKTLARVNGADVVAEARRWLGVPYLYGGTTARGIDCSGLVQQVFASLGITVPRTSEEQYGFCQPVKPGQERTGDLVFIVGSEIDASPGHVMIVTTPGNPDKVIDAPYTGTVVRYDTYSRTGTGVNELVGYGRVPGVGASPTGSESTLPLTTNKQNAASQVATAIAASGAVGYVFAGILIIIGIVLVGVFVWSMVKAF